MRRILLRKLDYLREFLLLTEGSQDKKNDHDGANHHQNRSQHCCLPSWDNKIILRPQRAGFRRPTISHLVYEVAGHGALHAFTACDENISRTTPIHHLC